ncbi:MAG: DJ-1/PfpI family protein [Clostridia bacterium]|nr:DJ-1/PfpI family protein [Clostridia bacterium]
MVYVFLAEGFEEMEALIPVDVLRRGKVDVKTVAIGGGKTVCGSHKISVNADISEDEFSPSDAQAIILPGGMPGTLNLEKNQTVKNAINYCEENKLLICAICAAPSILGKMGLLEGKNAVCFPGFEDALLGARLSDGIVCADGNIITAKGAGAALDFAVKILEKLTGGENAEKTEGALQRR